MNKLIPYVKVAELIIPHIDYPYYGQIVTGTDWYEWLRIFKKRHAGHSGLVAAITLFEATKQYRELIDEYDFEYHEKMSVLFLLDMIDQLDLWDEYMITWKWFENNGYKQLIDNRSQRKAIIQKKIQKRNKGLPLGNHKHTPPSDDPPHNINAIAHSVLDILSYAKQLTNNLTPNNTFANQHPNDAIDGSSGITISLVEESGSCIFSGNIHPDDGLTESPITPIIVPNRDVFFMD